MLNLDLTFTRQPPKKRGVRERKCEEERVKGGNGKNWAHINEFTAGAAQSSFGG